jgi:dihydrofolate reductase
MIILVAAMTRDRVIGDGNKIPWNIPAEIEHFRGIVRGKTIVMGRITFDSMPHPYQNCHEIVVTTSQMRTEYADVCPTIEIAIKQAQSYGPDVYIIGGQTIFEQTIGMADMMCLSFIKSSYDGDRFFPKFDPAQWTVKSREDFPEFEYAVYARKRD